MSTVMILLVSKQAAHTKITAIKSVKLKKKTVAALSCLNSPNTLNIDNYNAAVEELKQDAKYGNGTDKTEGRIWWDVE